MNKILVYYGNSTNSTIDIRISNEILKETCWAISNLSGCQNEKLSSLVLTHSQVWESIKKLMISNKCSRISIEIIYIFKNIYESGHNLTNQLMTDIGLFEFILECLKSNDNGLKFNLFFNFRQKTCYH